MSERQKKQLKYLAIFLSPFLLMGIIFLKIYFSSPPSCYDNRRNQGETGVDCGGPCPPCEVKNLSPLVKFPVRYAIYPDGSYDFAFKIFNPNENWGLKKITVSLIFFDENQKPIFESEPQISFLYPKETRWLIFSNLKPPQFSKVEPKIVIDDFDWAILNPPSLNLVFSSPQIKTTPLNTTEITFNVHNQSIFDFDEVEALVFLYNNDELVGISKTSFFIKREEVKEIKSSIPFEVKANSVEIIFQPGSLK